MDKNHTALKRLFLKHLDREPTQNEYDFHLEDYLNDPEQFERKLMTCEEKRSIDSHPKIAVLVSGHPRNLKFLKNFMDQKLYMNNVDLFIFSWDQWGKWGEETNLDDPTSRIDIENEFKNIPRVKKYKIESNKKWIEQNDVDPEISFFRFSRVSEVFIKSQLYAISQSFKLMEDYVRETGTKYDLVIKTRFELSIKKFNIDYKTIELLNNSKTIFVPDSRDSSHSHPHPSYCMSCDDIYKNLNLQEVHLFEHDNPICDTYAYGSMSSMKKYCSLYDSYESLCKKFEKRNIEMMNKIQTPHEKIGNVYSIRLMPHIEPHAIHFYFCSYPERLFMYFLKDYLLPRSEKIILGWNFGK